MKKTEVFLSSKKLITWNQKRKTQNSECLKSFTKYCEKYPDQRFWQALRNWSEVPFLYAYEPYGYFVDTFFWEGRNDIMKKENQTLKIRG